MTMTYLIIHLVCSFFGIWLSIYAFNKLTVATLLMGILLGPIWLVIGLFSESDSIVLYKKK